VEYIGSVQAVRHPGQTIAGAILWCSGDTGYAGKERMDAVLTSVNNHIDKFAGDWMKANPKR
jgi:hypothetical protein